MKQYLDILQKILDEGEWQDNRTGIRTLAVPNIHFEHDMSDGSFPLITTRKMPIKSLLIELNGFLLGICSKKWYEDRGCKYWSYWANPIKVQKKLDNMNTNDFFHDEHHQCDPDIRKQIQLEEDDLGPFYAHSWRRFGQIVDEDHDGVMKGFDQISYVIDKLKNDPNDRRMVVSAWNPHDLDRTSLPSCHYTFCLTHINGKLSLHWMQRSADFFLGVSNNIASYATLLLLFCKEANLKPYKLSATFCNAHIYENHLNQVKEQLTRKPRSLPKLEIINWKGIYDWTYNDIKLSDYNPYSPIIGKVAI